MPPGIMMQDEHSFNENSAVSTWERAAHQMHRIQNDRRFTDLKIECQEKTFHEAMTNTIKLDDEDPLFVQEMINFFYNSDYNLPEISRDFMDADFDWDAVSVNWHGNDQAIAKLGLADSSRDLGVVKPSPALAATLGWARSLFHVSMYALADRLLIPALKQLAISKFDRLTRSRDIKCLCLGYVVRSIYTSTPPSDRAMRDIITKRVAENMDRLRVPRNPILEPSFFDQVPQFARDLLAMVIDKLPADTARSTTSHDAVASSLLLPNGGIPPLRRRILTQNRNPTQRRGERPIAMRRVVQQDLPLY
ncbi:hypothetical protein N7488_004498 [Penicillium malachiteum]|nr:hypothetical protein N7488_004498 [Penicillium malachiteum]